MKKFIIVLLVLAAVAAAIFLIIDRDVVEEDPLTVPDISEVVTIDLVEESESGQSGVAIIEDIDGMAFVRIEIVPGDEGILQPAHIHFDNCENIGGVKYPLNSVVDGMSETQLDVSVDQILSERPLSINVHRSIEEAQIYVACGDI